MKFDKSACIGALIGYFVVMGTIQLSALGLPQAIMWGVLGIAISIALGVISATWQP